ncbi:YfbR-like 5'-deoxynucleotidase [Maritimibacter alexandrii]|uniref:YfbR-like 5'-deoxynucleotidase n=1 Tax=Maritimibacter alexandrii TaxID=2570355 RepID=UPI001109CC5F|nr:YfbR-like 5'-deoxynucleotidase [Maritimibacter alexandrii]
MPNLVAIFRAGFVRRWHMNPDLAHTCDRIDGHSARVARILIALHPNPSFALIREALTHDDGESVVGDIKAPTKDADPAFATRLAEIEARATRELWDDLISPDDLSVTDRTWLKFADRLDAYMWAAHHAPYVLYGDGWPEARAALIRSTAELLSDLPRQAEQVCDAIERMGWRG